jgi:hypothetical protein
MVLIPAQQLPEMCGSLGIFFLAASVCVLPEKKYLHVDQKP